MLETHRTNTRPFQNLEPSSTTRLLGPGLKVLETTPTSPSSFPSQIQPRETWPTQLSIIASVTVSPTALAPHPTTVNPLRS